MSKTPRQAPAPAQPDVDPREAPGSYLKTEDGFTQAQPVTQPAAGGASEAAPAPAIPIDSATAIAMALAAVGHEAPTYLGVDLSSGPDLTLTTLSQPGPEAGGDA